MNSEEVRKLFSLWSKSVLLYTPLKFLKNSNPSMKFFSFKVYISSFPQCSANPIQIRRYKTFSIKFAKAQMIFPRVYLRISPAFSYSSKYCVLKQKGTVGIIVYAEASANKHKEVKIIEGDD